MHNCYIQAYKSCPAWPPGKLNLTSQSNRERDIFTNSSQFKKMQRDVSERLGYKKVLPLGKI